MIYCAIAALWILLSDLTVEVLLSDPMQIIHTSMIKGWLFVAVTTLLLYLLVRHMVAHLHAAHRREIEDLQARQRSQDLLLAIADNSEDAIFAKDLEGRYLLFNNAASRVVGKPVAEVLGRDDRAIFPADQAAKLMAAGRRVIVSGRTEVNEEILDTAQGRRVFLATKGPLRDAEQHIFGTFGLSRDITAQKHSDDIRRESEARFRALFDSMSSGVAVYRAIDEGSDFVFVDFNPAGEKIEKRARDEIIGKRLTETFPGVDEFGLLAVFRRVWRSGQPEHFPVKQYRDQRICGWRENFVCRLPSGEVAAIYDDITEQKRIEEALAQSEDRFRSIVDASADWIWEVDTQGHYTYASESVEQLLGYTPAEVVGKTPFDFMPPDEAARVRSEFFAIAARKAPFRDLDNINLHKDGSPRYVWTNGMPILDTAGNLLGYRGLDRDITERKAAEEALRRNYEELQRFNRASIGRELDMLEMKKTINALSRELGREAPYPLDFLEGA